MLIYQFFLSYDLTFLKKIVFLQSSIMFYAVILFVICLVHQQFENVALASFTSRVKVKQNKIHHKLSVNWSITYKLVQIKSPIVCRPLCVFCNK